jgi:ketosteroid isomerase-like protein
MGQWQYGDTVIFNDKIFQVSARGAKAPFLENLAEKMSWRRFVQRPDAWGWTLYLTNLSSEGSVSRRLSVSTLWHAVESQGA